jgi:hypothetical protein
VSVHLAGDLRGVADALDRINSPSDAHLVRCGATELEILQKDLDDLWKAAWAVVETETLRSDRLCHSQVDRFRLEDLRSKLMTRAMLNHLTEHPEVLNKLAHRLQTNAIID